MFAAQHFRQLDERYVHLGLDRGQDDATIRRKRCPAALVEHFG